MSYYEEDFYEMSEFEEKINELKDCLRESVKHETQMEIEMLQRENERLKIKNIDLETARFYNEYNYGSYLIFRGIPVFIDSRADLYAPEFSGKEQDIFMDFIDMSSIGTFYGDIFEKYDMTHVITYKNSGKRFLIFSKLKNICIYYAR